MALASGGETPVKRAWSSTALAAVRACSSLEAAVKRGGPRSEG